MKILLIFLIAIFVIGNQYGYAEVKNILTVRYFDNYDAPYELEIDSDQNYLLSQSYSWVRDQSSRYNLIGYSIDGGDIIEISRKARGNFTLDVAMDVSHSIVFFAVPQFPLLVKGLPDYTFSPKSLTDDNWFDSNTSVRVEFPSTLQRSEGERQVVVKWILDNNMIRFANNKTDSLSTDHILMTDSHTVDIHTKTQYQIEVLSDYGVPFGNGWYDAGSKVTLGVNTPDGLFAKKFESWGGDSIINKNPTMFVIDSPKTITARWGIDYTVIAIILSVIAASVAVMYMKTRSRIKSVQKDASEKDISVQKLIHDDQYDSDINKLLETKALEELESYFTNGLIDEEKYLRIKTSLITGKQ